MQTSMVEVSMRSWNLHYDETVKRV